MGVERSGSRQSERRRSSVALASALLLHALLLGSLAVHTARSPSALAPPAHTAKSHGVEVELEPAPPSQDTEELAPAGQLPSSSPSPALPRTAARAAGTPTPSAPGVVAAAGALGAPLAEDSTAPQVNRRESSPKAPSLSLDELGVGATNPFIQRGAGQRPFDPKSAAQVSRRAERVLADGIANADQRRGLGPEGPLLASLEQAARRSTTPPNSSALFRLSTDGSGMLVGVQVIDANSDHAVWQKLGDQVRASLGKKRLRGSHGENGLTFEVRVISRVALPSGRDPGLQFDALGLPLHKPKGAKNPTKIGVLNMPRYSVQTVTLPDGRTIEVPVITASVLEVQGDPVDIGAPAQRIVHARLERLWAN